MNEYPHTERVLTGGAASAAPATPANGDVVINSLSVCAFSPRGMDGHQLRHGRWYIHRARGNACSVCGFLCTMGKDMSMEVYEK